MFYDYEVTFALRSSPNTSHVIKMQVAALARSDARQTAQERLGEWAQVAPHLLAPANLRYVRTKCLGPTDWSRVRLRRSPFLPPGPG